MDMHKTPPLAQTIRGYITHAPANWRAHMAAAADQIETAAKLRSEIEELVKVSAAGQADVARVATELAELRDELGALLPEIAAMARQNAALQDALAVARAERDSQQRCAIRAMDDLAAARALLRRYRNETPLGHQPHMIAHEVDVELAKDSP